MAAQLGYCGLDAQRRPLRGDEIRACWDAPIAATETSVTSLQGPALAPLNVVQDRTPVRRLEFVEVRSTPVASSGQTAATRTETEISDATQTRIVTAPAEPSWSLWGDAEI